MCFNQNLALFGFRSVGGYALITSFLKMEMGHEGEEEGEKEHGDHAVVVEVIPWSQGKRSKSSWLVSFPLSFRRTKRKIPCSDNRVTRGEIRLSSKMTKYSQMDEWAGSLVWRLVHSLYGL